MKYKRLRKIKLNNIAKGGERKGEKEGRKQVRGWLNG